MADRSAPVADNPYGNAAGQGVVAPQDNPQPAMTERADPGAWGAVGGAVQKLGATGEGLAEHFSQLAADASARDAVTAQSQQLSDAEVQFRSQRGMNAVNGLKSFQQQATGFVNNPPPGLSLAAQELYKNQIAGMVNNSMNRAGMWAADQADQAQVSSLNASMANHISLGAMNIADPNSRTSTISSLRDDALQYSHFQGLSPDVADKLVSHNIGEYYQNGIRSTMQSNPDMAKSLYDEAINGSFTAMRPDANGNMMPVKVPYIDDAHRGAISTEMSGEWRRQESESLYSARMDAMGGNDFNTQALTQSMQRAGRSPDYINAQIEHLNKVQDNFGSAAKAQTVEGALKNDWALALDGKSPVGSYDPAQIAAAFPHNPSRQQEILLQAQDAHDIASFRSGMATQTPDQILQATDRFKPQTPVNGNQPVTSDMAINHVIDKFEGSTVNPDDGGRGPSKFGIVASLHPGVDVNTLTREEASTIYKKEYWDEIGADKLPENMKLMAFDTAVNFGAKAAKDMIAQSGNDPQKLTELRLDKHQDLLLSDPDKYGKYAGSWNDRDMSLAYGTADIPSNYDHQSRLYSTAQQVAHTYIKQLYDDPAGMINNNDVKMSGMLSSALSPDGMKDPRQLTSYIDSSLAQQQAKGVPENLQSALPKSAAISITDNIISNPETAPNTINKWAQQAGDHWPSVYKSLVTQGGLPSYYQSVAQLGADPTTEKYATRLARYAAIDGEDKNQGKNESDLFGAKTVKDTETAIQSDPRVTQYVQSLASTGASTKQIDDVMHSIRSLSFANRMYDKSGADPTQTAIDAFTKNFEYMPQGGARVPSDKFDSVSQRAKAALDNLEQVAASPNIYNTGYHGLPKPQEYYNLVRAAPSWVTSPDGNSITLYNNMNRIVLGKDGKPVTVPFSIKAQATQPGKSN